VYLVRFLDSPNGPIAIADVEAQILTDELSTRRFRQRLAQALGGLPILMRCQTGSSVQCDGPPSLRRYALDPMVEALPPVGIDLNPPVDKAA
jgi:hypothetical protein